VPGRECLIDLGKVYTLDRDTASRGGSGPLTMNSSLVMPISKISKQQVKLEPATLDQIASGKTRVDYRSCQERVAFKCLTCQQQLLFKDTEECLRLTFRKGHESSGIYEGYLISAEVPKSKQMKQVVCLSCIDRLLGSIAQSADGLSITLERRKDGGGDAVIMQRHGSETFWTQSLELTDG
jgi:hypothetical protein